MDPEAEARYQRIEQILRDLAGRDDEFDGKLRNLADIVFSLGHTSSEHDELLEQVKKTMAEAAGTLASLTQTSRDHDQKIDRIIDVLTALAAADERMRREFLDRNARVDEELRKHDEQIAILVRMMDEWIRRQPPNGKGA